jgi:hypothetical protein
MKKIVSLLFLLAFTLSASAQDLIYHAYGTENSQQQAQPTSQIVRATAIFVRNGEYYKAPIQVEITSSYNHYGGTSCYVVAVWNNVSYSGSWTRLPNKAAVQRCLSSSAYGATTRLEKSYMYKALIGYDWYYFDL